MRQILGMFEEFLSNKKNVIGLVAILNLIVGFVLWSGELTTIQIIVVILLLSLSNVLVYTLGISQGIVTMEILQSVKKTLKKNKKYKKRD